MRIPSAIIIAFSILLFAVFPLSAADSPSLEKAANRAVAALKSGDFKSFIGMCSKRNGVIVARRGVDWDRSATSGGDDDTHFKSSLFTGKYDLLGFEHDNLQGLVWVEEETEFSLDDTDRDSFHKVFVRFCKEMKDTYGDTNISMHLWDAWRQRNLGPAANGPMASNYEWYIYFTLENGQWKVWRMELAVH
jgi:hypothetical protein